MINALLGQKMKMSQIFREDGTLIPVTILSLGPCIITQIKTADKHGYSAIQLGFGTTNKLKQAMRGHLKKSLPAGQAGGAAPRFIREIRVESNALSNIKEGETIKITDVFGLGDKINITGISKGKGFAGVVKRWGFHGGPKTHGQGDRLRAPGSIGSQSVGRVFKGKKMAGRMGSQRVTVKGLEIIDLDAARNLVKVKGAVPGQRGNLLIIRKQL